MGHRACDLHGCYSYYNHPDRYRKLVGLSSRAVHRAVDNLCRNAAIAVGKLGIALWTSGSSRHEQGHYLRNRQALVVRRKNAAWERRPQWLQVMHIRDFTSYVICEPLTPVRAPGLGERPCSPESPDAAALVAVRLADLAHDQHAHLRRTRPNAMDFSVLA
jgi:hypothetical protein